MASADWIEKEIRRSFVKASRLGALLAKKEARAKTAAYVARAESLRVDLTNGAMIQIPVRLIPELRGIGARDLRRVEVWGRGSTLYWERQDLDLRVPELISSVFKGPAFMAELGRAGGRSSSEAKAKAARRNGRKGGRPRVSRA